MVNAKLKWEMAKYLIDAKKCVDTLMFIEENIDCLHNLNLRKRRDELLREFFINCVVILDYALPKKSNTQKEFRKQVIADNAELKSILYERDKRYAHKDLDRVPLANQSLGEIIDDLKVKLKCIREICASILPENVDLIYVPYDRDLFRQMLKITPEVEAELRARRYPEQNELKEVEGEPHKVVVDIEDGRHILDTKGYCTVLENGLTTYEGLQNRQDWCIKTNALFGLNMWCTATQEDMAKMFELDIALIVKVYYEIIQHEKGRVIDLSIME